MRPSKASKSSGVNQTTPPKESGLAASMEKLDWGLDHHSQFPSKLD